MKRGLTILAAVAVLSACGGTDPSMPSATEAPPPATGGNPGGGNPGGGTQTPTTLTQTSITIDPSVPDAGKKLVTQVSTPTGIGTVGETLPLGYTKTTTAVLLLATDANNRIVLASMEPAGGSTALSVDSTAVALARIAMGEVGTEVADTDINQAIKDSPSFTPLLQAITNALMTGVPPSADGTVLGKVSAVQDEASNTLSSRARANTLTVKAVTEPTVDRALPYSLLGHLGDVPSVSIVEGNALGIKVSNSQPIWWTISTTTNAKVQLKPATALQYLTTLLPLARAANPVPLTDDGGRAFNVTLEADRDAKLASLVDLFRGTYNLALKGIADDKDLVQNCATKITAALSSSDLTALVVAPSLESFVTYLQGLGKDVKSPTTASGLLKACLNGDSDNLGIALAQRAAALARMALDVAPLKQIATAYKVGGLVYQAAYLKYYWGDTGHTIGVCESTQTGGLQISNCAVRFTVTPEDLPLIPGAKYTPAYVAKDKVGSDTLLPAKLKFSSENSAKVKVDETTGALEAGDLGSARITIADDSIPVTQSFPVDVMDPILFPATTTMVIGENKLLQLIDAAGRNVIVGGVALEWTSSNTSVISNILGLVTSHAAGSATITVTNPVTGRTTKSDITVTDSVKSLTLALPEAVTGWNGLPATITLQDLVPTTLANFQANGANCAERGNATAGVPADATIFAVRTVTGMPSRQGGPVVNRNPCSSFFAYKWVAQADPAAPKVLQAWITAAGRGFQTGGSATLDWEYQIRFSGNPLAPGGGTTVLGVVPNSGFFNTDFTTTAPTVAFTPGPPPVSP